MRRNILRFLGIAIAGLALVMYINWAGDRDEAKPAATSQLSCAGDIASAQATAPPTTKETRTPAQLAAAWIKSRSPDLAGGQRTLREDKDRVDIAFDKKAQTVAVLTYRADKTLGWHLDAVAVCR